MEIIKVFNNNSVAAMSDELGDIVLTGSGIGFKKKPGDPVDEEKIEKTYLFKDKQQKRLTREEDDVDPIYYEITSKIVNKATQELHTQFYGEIFLAISDHIAFAIKRYQAQVYLPNVILSETKVLYKKQYQIGLWAIEYIARKTHIRLEESEAGYIALHLVNFSLDNKSHHNATKIVTFTKEVLAVIQATMKVEFEEDSFTYTRITTHLKYLAERIFHEKPESFQDTTANIREMLKEDLRLALCINRIVKLIQNRYDYTLSPDEQTYLCIHIQKYAQR